MNLCEQVQYRAAFRYASREQAVTMYDAIGIGDYSDYYRIINGQAPLYLSQYLLKKKALTYNFRKKRLSSSLSKDLNV